MPLTIMENMILNHLPSHTEIHQSTIQKELRFKIPVWVVKCSQHIVAVTVRKHWNVMTKNANLKEIRTLKDTVKLVIKNVQSPKMTNVSFQILSYNQIKEVI